MSQRGTMTDVLGELARFSTAEINDAMRRMGIRGWLGGLTTVVGAKPHGCTVGPVLTVQWAPKQGRATTVPGLYEIMRGRKHETILLIAGGRPDGLLVGENNCTAARVAGFEAVLVDGCARDIAELPSVGIGVWAIGVNGAHSDTMGVAAYNVPVMFRGEWVVPGDVVAVDADGGVVFPGERAAELLEHTRVISELEQQQGDVIRRNGSLDDLAAVLRRKRHV
jgi:4-hydroxy-4-methyl-2-oxoglutarate aldolase